MERGRNNYGVERPWGKIITAWSLVEKLKTGIQARIQDTGLGPKYDEPQFIRGGGGNLFKQFLLFANEKAPDCMQQRDSQVCEHWGTHWKAFVNVQKIAPQQGNVLWSPLHSGKISIDPICCFVLSKATLASNVQKSTCREMFHQIRPRPKLQSYLRTNYLQFCPRTETKSWARAQGTDQNKKDVFTRGLIQVVRLLPPIFSVDNF